MYVYPVMSIIDIEVHLLCYKIVLLLLISAIVAVDVCLYPFVY